MQREDDEAWRSIVENFGDRAQLDDPEPPLEERHDAPDADDEDPEPTLLRPAPEPRPATPRWDDEYPDADWDEDRFVPPAPPPLPRTTTDLLVAWIGLFGSPALLLVCLLFGFAIPELLAYALVAGFIGGFLYLVVKMPREPRDPDDDGAVL